jgi:hypothetical protein
LNRGFVAKGLGMVVAAILGLVVADARLLERLVKSGKSW